METKRQRQLINRAEGFSGSFIPMERAKSIARHNGLSGDSNIHEIRLMDRAERCHKLQK